MAHGFCPLLSVTYLTDDKKVAIKKISCNEDCELYSYEQNSCSITVLEQVLTAIRNLEN